MAERDICYNSWVNRWGSGQLGKEMKHLFSVFSNSRTWPSSLGAARGHTGPWRPTLTHSLSAPCRSAPQEYAGGPCTPLPPFLLIFLFLWTPDSHCLAHSAHPKSLFLFVSTFPPTLGLECWMLGGSWGLGGHWFGKQNTKSHPCFGSSVTLGGLLDLSEPQFPWV